MGGVSGRTADLTQVRSTPLPANARLTARTTGVVEGCDDMVGHKGSHGSRVDPQPFLEDDDRPGVPFTRIQPYVVRNHGRGFPRPHQPSPSTSGYGADHSPVPAPARAFDGSPNGSRDGTPTNGVASNAEPRVPAQGRRSPRSFPNPDANPITKSLLQSDTDRARLRHLIDQHR
ncbi:hypothetical protein BHE74_00059619 [Ensete ventricosum]|nr:hypothetical protein BHE74_00059619 [Ensete ventricosum]